MEEREAETLEFNGREIYVLLLLLKYDLMIY